MPKNWCFWTVVLEQILESPLDCKDIKSINPKGNHPWIFIGSTDAEAEASIFWQLNMKNRLIKKRPWCWEILRAGEGDGIGRDCLMSSWTQLTWIWAGSGRWWSMGSLACCSPWGRKESGMNEPLNNNNNPKLYKIEWNPFFSWYSKTF